MLHISALAQESAYISDELAPARTTEKRSSPPVASIHPLRMDAAPSADAGPPGNFHGSGSGTRYLRTASALGQALRTAVLQQPVRSKRHSAEVLRSVKGIFAEVIVQDCLEQPVRSKTHSAAAHQQPVRPEKHSAAVP